MRFLKVILLILFVFVGGGGGVIGNIGCGVVLLLKLIKLVLFFVNSVIIGFWLVWNRFGNGNCWIL